MFPFSSFDPFDDDPFLKKLKQNKEKLESAPAVYGWKQNKKLRSPIRGYDWHEGEADAEIWVGNPAKTLHKKSIKEPVYQLSDPNSGFRVVYQDKEDTGNILAAYYHRPDGKTIFTHVDRLSELFFEHYEFKSVYLRAAIPRIDEKMKCRDRRMEKIRYETPSGQRTRTRLFRFWVLVCKGMVPLQTFDKNADDDQLCWTTPYPERGLTEDEKTQLNQLIPLENSWHF